MSETLIGLGATAALGAVGAAVKWGWDVSRRLTVLETVMPRVEQKIDEIDKNVQTLVKRR